MTKFHRLLLFSPLAIAGIVGVPTVTKVAVAPHFATKSATQPTQLAMAELQSQDTAPRQELRNGSGDKQPASAASSNNTSNNSSASSAETKDKKSKKKDKAKSAPSDHDEQFKRELLGIYG